MKNIFYKMDLIQLNTIVLFFLGSIVLLFIIKKTFNKRMPLYLRLILLYIFLIISQLAFGNYVMLSTGNERLVNLSAYIFAIFEYAIFAILLSSFIKSTIVKKYLIFSCILFIFIGIISWYSISLHRRALSFITSVECISLIPFCLYYSSELLNRPPFLKITGEPSFWITTGILFLLICLTPYYLAFNYFRKNNEMQMIDFLGYDLIVLFLAKASFTKPKSANG
jgi:hypothetical protein